MKANTVEEYLGTLQQSMVESWKSHLKTDKYSAHKALNEFYDDVIDLVDTLIEAYQGLHGKVEGLKNIMSTDKMSAIDYLEELREMTAEGREQFFEEPELQSDVDAILSLIDGTLYKLKELKENRIFSLKDYLVEKCLNESIITEATTKWKIWTEGSVVTDKADSMNIDYKGNKKYGFVYFSPMLKDTGVAVTLEAFDSIEDLAEAISVEEEYIPSNILKLSVGESYTEHKQTWLRIW